MDEWRGAAEHEFGLRATAQGSAQGWDWGLGHECYSSRYRYETLSLLVLCLVLLTCAAGEMEQAGCYACRHAEKRYTEVISNSDYHSLGLLLYGAML